MQVSRGAFTDGVSGAAAFQQIHWSTCMDVVRQALKLDPPSPVPCCKEEGRNMRPGEWERCPSVSFH